MRVRIAATKATQKITKAMQMVAASKLRRAQVAAEAARPYAERMDKVLGSIAAAVAGSDSAPRLLAGTGADKVHLLVVCTAERGLCGAFNSSIVRLARERANALLGQGKDVKILCVGRKGADQLRRQFERHFVEIVELRGVKQMGFAQAQMIADKIVARFDNNEFDVCTVFFSRFKSVISQIPTAQQIIPPVFEPVAKDAGATAAYEYEPGKLAAVAQAKLNRQTISGPFGKAAAVHEDLLLGYPHAVPQHDCGVLAVIAIPAIAVEHDFFGGQADLDHVGEIVLRVEPIEVVGAGNVTRPVVLLVARVYEDDPVLLPPRIVKELHHSVALGQLQAFGLEAGRKQLDGRVGLCGCGAGHIGAFHHRGRRRELGPGEVIPGEQETARRKRIGGKGQSSADHCHQRGFLQHPFH